MKAKSSGDSKGVKKELKHLQKLYESNQKNTQVLKSTINDLHKRLKNLDDKEATPKKSNVEVTYSISDMQTMEDKLVLHNKITIKKKRRSKSFLRWLFNNNDL